MSNNTDFNCYEQRLGSIPPSKAARIHTLIQFVAFGNEPLMRASSYDRHPLTLSQLSEVTGYDDSAGGPLFNAGKCLSADEIIQLCDGILDTEEFPRNRYCGDPEIVTTVRFSNEEVRNFLLSDQICNGTVARFAIEPGSAREKIVNVCLTYMLNMHTLPAEKKDAQGGLSLPFAYFASLWWSHFVPLDGDTAVATQRCLDSFFILGPIIGAYQNWLQLLVHANDAHTNKPYLGKIYQLSTHEKDRVCHSCTVNKCRLCCYAPPIVWASAFGVGTAVQTLLDRGENVNEGGVARVSALYMAVKEGHYLVAESLFKHGGDVANDFIESDDVFHGSAAFFYRSDSDRSPLYHAARFGKEEFLILLLSDPYRIGRPGWRLERALEHLANTNKKDVAGCVELLVQAGVDVNALGTEGACALQTATLNWNEGVVKALLENGANPNNAGGEYHIPIQAAAYRPQPLITQLLLSHGADPNPQGGVFGTALIAASWCGNVEIVSLLLRAGADLDVEWDLHAQIYSMGGLNFTTTELVTDSENKPTGLRKFGKTDPRTEKAYEDPVLLPDDPNDQDPNSEHEFRRRLDADAESRIENRKKARLMRAHRTALEERYRICREIRRAGGRIARRLREAGVMEGKEGEYLFSAMQAAVAQERKEVVDVLKRWGLEVPPVVAIGEEESVREAEAWAARLRGERSIYSEQRGADGKIYSSTVSSNRGYANRET